MNEILCGTKCVLNQYNEYAAVFVSLLNKKQAVKVCEMRVGNQRQ